MFAAVDVMTSVTTDGGAPLVPDWVSTTVEVITVCPAEEVGASVVLDGASVVDVGASVLVGAAEVASVLEVGAASAEVDEELVDGSSVEVGLELDVGVSLEEVVDEVEEVSEVREVEDEGSSVLEAEEEVEGSALELEMESELDAVVDGGADDDDVGVLAAVLVEFDMTKVGKASWRGCLK